MTDPALRGTYPNKDKFSVGDEVRATGNYLDEQLGQFAPASVQTVLKVRDTSAMQGTTGQWIWTDRTGDWVDSAWFQLASEPAAETWTCHGCGLVHPAGEWHQCVDEDEED